MERAYKAGKHFAWKNGKNIASSKCAKNSSVSTCTPRGTSGVWLLLPFRSRLQGALPTPLGWVFTRTNGIVRDGVHRDLLWQSYKRHMVIVGDMTQKPPTLFFPDKGQTHVLQQQTRRRPNQKTSIICVTTGAFQYK